jgi:hypothetical protein
MSSHSGPRASVRLIRTSDAHASGMNSGRGAEAKQGGVRTVRGCAATTPSCRRPLTRTPGGTRAYQHRGRRSSRTRHAENAAAADAPTADRCITVDAGRARRARDCGRAATAATPAHAGHRSSERLASRFAAEPDVVRRARSGSRHPIRDVRCGSARHDRRTRRSRKEPACARTRSAIRHARHARGHGRARTARGRKPGAARDRGGIQCSRRRECRARKPDRVGCR